MSATINSAILSASFTTVSSPGTVSCPGLKVGDRLISLTFQSSIYDQSPAIGNGWFEGIVTVDDEIQQINGSPSIDFYATFVRLG